MSLPAWEMGRCRTVGLASAEEWLRLRQSHEGCGDLLDSSFAVAEQQWPVAVMASYSMLSKSAIPALFKRYCPKVDPLPYLATAHVFPMRATSHVVEKLIDWSNIPNDPMFQLLFPQPEMLRSEELSLVCRKLLQGSTKVELRKVSEEIRKGLNPHPSRQKEENVPVLRGRPVEGIQHKYKETVLFFPAEGQFCHAFCTYCFRWAQFTSVGSSQAFKNSSRTQLVDYVESQPQVTDVLFTGGDPMVMSAQTVADYVAPLLLNRMAHLQTIRFGTKSLAWWPQRYLDAPDAKDLLATFERIVEAGKHVTIQAHFSHLRELLDPTTQAAIRAIRSTGAQIRCQAPLIRHVNDDADMWASMWRLQARLGLVPYYMFVERDTGARHYFGLPLVRAHDIFTRAYETLPGVARTVRGPTMSASPGKVCVLGVEDVGGERVFVLKFLQARVPHWCGRVFFAKYDESASWFDDLQPAFGEDRFFFQDEYESMRARSHEGSSGQIQLTDEIGEATLHSHPEAEFA